MQHTEPELSQDSLARTLFVELGLPCDGAYLVAFSGGADSTAMLHVLSALRERFTFLRVRAIHVHHGLHAAADEWAAHCARFCASEAIPLSVCQVAVYRRGKGMEAAARRARYDALSARLACGEILLTAHHRDDQAETLLLNLLRGTGVPGLAGMAPSVQFGRGLHVRPLLAFSRVTLRNYCGAHGLTWIEDPSNDNRAMRRNWLRHEVIPVLARYVPHVTAGMARAAMHARDANSVLEETGATDVAAAEIAPFAGPDGFPAPLAVARIARHSPARQRNLLRSWFRLCGFEGPDTRKLEELRNLVGGTFRGKRAQVRFAGGVVCRYQQAIFLLPALAGSWHGELAWQIESPQPLSDGFTRLRVAAGSNGGLSAARIRDRRITLQYRQGGERLLLAGHRQHHPLKKYLNEHRVPPWWRDRLPLIYVDGELAAVGNLAVCAPFAAQEGEASWQLVWERDMRPPITASLPAG